MNVEALMDLYPFDLEQLTINLKGDFEMYHEGEIFFFTEEMTDEYIKKATEMCDEEIKAIQKKWIYN